MIELTDVNDEAERTIVSMGDMKPLEVGRVISSSSPYYNHYVLRTASRTNFEVIDLTQVGETRCWESSHSSLKVELLPRGRVINLKLFNE